MLNRIFSKDKFWIILVVLSIIPTFSSLLRPGYFPMHDDMQAMRLLEMDKCIKDGQIPCRWVPDMGYKYGYPQFNYYAPLPYYVMEFFHLVGFGYLDSVKAGFILSVFIAAFGMFIFGKSLWGTLGGFISALLFAYAPYRAVDMYVRGAVGEFWAMSFLPIILWSVREVFRGKRERIPWLAVSLAGLLTSHNITSLMFAPLVLAWTFFLILTSKTLDKGDIFKKTKDIFIGCLWGLAISAFFVLPAWLEKNFVHIETLTAGYFNYLAHFVSLSQLLLSTYWGYGTSELGPYDDLSLAVGPVHWVLPLLALFLLLLFKKRKEIILISFFIVFGWLALFLTHSRSTFIWSNLNIFSFFQFPWRFLTLTTFLFSTASGAIGLLFPKEDKSQIIFSGFLILVAVIFYASYFRPQKWIPLTDKEKFSGDLWQKQLTISIFDYLPIYAKKPPASGAPDKPEISQGEGEIISGDKGTNWQRWTINIYGQSATLSFALFYFPGWKVWSDEKEIPVNYNNELGVITISLSKGKHMVFAKLTDTPVRSFANLATLGGLIALPIFFAKRKKFE